MGLACAGGYASVGLALSDGALMEKDDLVFQADTPRVITELTRAAGRHYRTKVHPTFVLLLNPLGRALRAALGRPRLAAILLTALFGGVAVAAMRQMLLRAGLAEPLPSMWTLMFATSSAHVFFSSVPESFVFSAASLIVLFALGARGAPPALVSVLAGIAAFGMVVTNAVAALLLELTRPRPGWRRVAAAVASVATVVVVSAGLAALQKRIYPDSVPFYARGSFSEEPTSVKVPRGAAAAERARDVAAHVLLFNLAAPEVAVGKPSARFPVTTFAPLSLDHLRASGRVHAVLWLGLIGLAAFRLVRGPESRPPLLAPLGGWILFNAGLHLVYGEDLFLYTEQWTFAVVALVALALGPHPRLPIVLAALVGTQVLANAALLADLFRIYG
jgi:hypothetical protein